MDNKVWRWRKRSLEKTIVANTKSNFSSKGAEEEMLPTEKEVSLERSLENLNEELASVLRESSGKDDLLARHAKIAEEAITDQEKAEAVAVSLKEELEKALQQKEASNERLTQVNAALKESMQQLTSVREEQEQRLLEAVRKTSREFEKAQKKMEEKLTEKGNRLANLTAENTRLSKNLLGKEKLIEDLSEHASQAEAEFNTLMTRLDSTEKENAFLKYEFRMLEKELEIRNEESEFNRQSADVSRKQHLESVKKVMKLEAECHRLRVLVRKRLPGPAALAKMNNEVEILGRNQSDVRRKRSNLVTGNLVVRDTTLQNPPDIPSKKITLLIERLWDVEEENKALKEILAKKDGELHSSQIVCARQASELSMVEALLGELSKGKHCMKLECTPISKDLSSRPSFGIGNDEMNRSESWASALISELEHFRNRKPENPHGHKIFAVSDMSLMDDFVEMEQLAIVTVGTPVGSSCASSDASNVLAISLEESSEYHSDARGKELVPVDQGQSCDWLQNILKLILDQTRISNRSFDDLLEDIRIALTYMKHPGTSEAHGEETSVDTGASDSIPISGYITWKSPNTSPKLGSVNGDPHSDTLGEATRKQYTQIDLGEENKGLKEELKILESSRKELEARLSSANSRSKTLISQLQESEQSIGFLQLELNTLKESKRMVEDQMENQMLINEDLDTQLTVLKVKLHEVLQKLSSLEVELEDKSHCCEELESTCLELQLQLESATDKEVPKDSIGQEERLVQTGWEITTASAKLAECQETIFNLGKQLKALSSPREMLEFNKVFTTTIDKKKLSQRPSLRDQLLADGAEVEDLNSPKTKEVISTVEANKPSFLDSEDFNTLRAPGVLAEPPGAYLNFKNEAHAAAVGSLAIVPINKKRGGVGFLRKLLLRRMKGSRKKALP